MAEHDNRGGGRSRRRRSGGGRGPRQRSVTAPSERTRRAEPTRFAAYTLLRAVDDGVVRQPRDARAAEKAIARIAAGNANFKLTSFMIWLFSDAIAQHAQSSIVGLNPDQARRNANPRFCPSPHAARNWSRRLDSIHNLSFVKTDLMEHLWLAVSRQHRLTAASLIWNRQEL